MKLKFIAYLIWIFLSVLPCFAQAKTSKSAEEVTVIDSTAPKIRISKDSIVFYANGQADLYGEATVNYQQMELTSAQITINTDSSIVHALSGTDSTGAEIGRPIFKDGGESYESRQIDFNFKTKKGLIRDVVTTQGEGYVTSKNWKTIRS